MLAILDWLIYKPRLKTLFEELVQWMSRLTTERHGGVNSLVSYVEFFLVRISNDIHIASHCVASRFTLRYVTLRCSADDTQREYRYFRDTFSLRYTLRSVTFKSDFSQMCRGTYILIMRYQCTRDGCISEWPVTGAWPLNLYVYFFAVSVKSDVVPSLPSLRVNIIAAQKEDGFEMSKNTSRYRSETNIVRTVKIIV